MVVHSLATAAALAAALNGPVTSDVPTSALQRHPDVTVVADAGVLGGAGT